jgi:hypothetical protein
MPFKPIDPRLRDEAVDLAVTALHTAFGGSVRRIIGKGSAFSTDFIPYWSDLDIHVTLAPEICVAPGVPSLESTLTCQEQFAGIDAQAYTFQAIQVIVLTEGWYPGDWCKPVRGSYQVLVGDEDGADEPPEYYRGNAVDRLVDCGKYARQVIGQAVDAPDAKLPRVVRLAGCYLKSGVYNVAAACGEDPIGVWLRPLQEVFGLAEEHLPELEARSFYSLIRDWPETRREASTLRTMLGHALRDLFRFEGLGEAIRARG